METDTAETNDMGETKNGELQGSSSAPDIENKQEWVLGLLVCEEY